MPAQSTASNDTAFYSQHDTAPALVRTLTTDGVPIDLTNATGVTLTMAHATYDAYYSPRTRTVDRAACTVTDAANGVVSWTPTVGDLDAIGAFHLIYEITWTGGGVQTVPAHTYENLVVKAKPGGAEQL